MPPNPRAAAGFLPSSGCRTLGQAEALQPPPKVCGPIRPNILSCFAPSQGRPPGRPPSCLHCNKHCRPYLVSSDMSKGAVLLNSGGMAYCISTGSSGSWHDTQSQRTPPQHGHAWSLYGLPRARKTLRETLGETLETIHASNSYNRTDPETKKTLSAPANLHVHVASPAMTFLAFGTVRRPA